MTFENQLKEYLEFFNNSYEVVAKEIYSLSPKIISESMIYATADGGKRVRPVLCYATAQMLGLSIESVKNFALAIEFIHSYSLVHDDLPCMDNDDYRRGKLSTHKKFGEAYGVLCGDALLTFAFELCSKTEDFGVNSLKAINLLANYAGASGMVGGQVFDLLNEQNAEIEEKTLFDIYLNKTSKLLTAPLLIPSLLVDGKFFNELKEFGENLGLIFQITDDILDETGTLTSIGKTPHKDKNSDKFTSIKVYGLEGAKNKSQQLYQRCKVILKGIPNSEFLSSFLDTIYFRKK